MLDRFSIIVPSKTRVDCLRACLASLTRYAPAGAEIIVVDDASKHGIVTAAASEFAGVRIVRRERSLGFCAAVNDGIRAASREIVELFNDDAEATAHWWKAPLQAFEDPQVAAVTPLVLKAQPGPERIDSAGDDYDPGGFARKRKHNRPIEPMACRQVDAVSACAAFYRKSLLLAVGGFPEQFQAYFDDVDTSLRLRARGGKLLLEPSSIVRHRVSASYGRKPTRRLVELQSRNEEWLYWRNSFSWRTLPRHLLVLLAKAARRTEEGTLAPWLTGRLAALVRNR